MVVPPNVKCIGKQCAHRTAVTLKKRPLWYNVILKHYVQSQAGYPDMSADETNTNQSYIVVINHEEQYSIWAADREIPNGWKDVGKSGNKEECLNYISEVWTDMRPLSLRKQMDEDET